MADEKNRLYAVKPGHVHTYVINGTRVVASGDKGHTVPLSAAQYESFKDKFLPASEENAPDPVLDRATSTKVPAPSPEDDGAAEEAPAAPSTAKAAAKAEGALSAPAKAAS